MTDSTTEWPYSRDAFDREDDDDDAAFYQVDRFVPHLDRVARATVEKLIGALIVEERPAILDLMASWESHLPATLRPLRLAGLGLNQNEVEVARRRQTIGGTLDCPYCGSRLKKWAVPQSPFTEYAAEFMYVCFDDRCPFLVSGWDVMNPQGNHGLSCRFMYDPERDACTSVPVPSLRALRESVLEN
jgi:hypothetical protein